MTQKSNATKEVALHDVVNKVTKEVALHDVVNKLLKK